MPLLLFEIGWLTATGGVVSECALGGVLRTAVSVECADVAFVTGSRTVGVRTTVCSTGGDTFGAAVAVVGSGVLTGSAAACCCVCSSDFWSAGAALGSLAVLVAASSALVVSAVTGRFSVLTSTGPPKSNGFDSAILETIASKRLRI